MESLYKIVCIKSSVKFFYFRCNARENYSTCINYSHTHLPQKSACHSSIIIVIILSILFTALTSCQKQKPSSADIYSDNENTEKQQAAVIDSELSDEKRAILTSDINLTPLKSPVSLPAESESKTDSTDAIPFHQYRQDTKKTGRFPWKGPENPVLLAKIPVEGQVRASACFLPDGGFVIGTLNSFIYIFDTDCTIRKKIPMDSWIFASPVSDDRGIFYTACDEGVVSAISSKGDILWQYKLRAEISSSPVLYNNTLYLGAEDNALYALTTEGKKLWRASVDNRILFSSPAIDSNNGIYIGDEGGFLYKFNLQGYLQWKIKLGEEIGESSPIIAHNGTIYAVTSDAHIHAVTPEGALKWKLKIHEEVFSNPALSKEGILYCAALDGVVIAVDSEGSIKWKIKTGDKIKSSPIIDSEGNIYLAESESFFSLNPQGEKRWKLDLPGSSFNADPVLTNQGIIIIGGEDSFLYIIGEL